MERLNIDYVRAQLQRRSSERQLQRVAFGCNLSARTLNKILAGHNGHVDTIATLQRFLKSTEKRDVLDSGKGAKHGGQ